MRDVLLPQFGMGMTSGTIVAWHFGPDEKVREGDILFEVEAAKTTVEVPAPCDGILREIRAEVGQDVEVRAVVAVIDNGIGEAAPERTLSRETSVLNPETAPRSAANAVDLRTAVRRDGRQVEPRARRLARDNSIDLESVSGSGPGGRVIEEDVADFLARNRARDGGYRLELDAEYDLTPLRTLLSDLERSCPGLVVPFDGAFARIVSLAAERAGIAQSPIVVATSAELYVDCHRHSLSEGLRTYDEISCAIFARVWTMSSESIRRFISMPGEESLTMSLVSGSRQTCQLCLQFDARVLDQEAASALIAEMDALMKAPIAMLA